MDALPTFWVLEIYVPTHFLYVYYVGIKYENLVLISLNQSCTNSTFRLSFKYNHQKQHGEPQLFVHQ